MTDQPDYDRFSMPGEIPDASDPCWKKPGFDPFARAERERDERVRGYVMRSAAGRGWEVEDDCLPQAPAGPSGPSATGLTGRRAVALAAQSADGCDLADSEAGGAGGGPVPAAGRGPEETATPAPFGRPPLLTPARQAEFCEQLSHHGNVRLACRALGISSQTAYRARRANPHMRACWDAALVLAREAVEEVLADRAIHGVEESVFYHGEEVATRRRYDSRLLLAHLARLDRRAEQAAICEDCTAPLVDEETFDAALEALGKGEEILPGQCSMCSRSAAGEEANDGAGEDAGRPQGTDGEHWDDQAG